MVGETVKCVVTNSAKTQIYLDIFLCFLPSSELSQTQEGLTGSRALVSYTYCSISWQ